MIECPDCQRIIDPVEVCECGYEHQCGGPAEACMIPGCPECNHPDLGSIGKGHICRHGIHWPHACSKCDDLAFKLHKARSRPNPEASAAAKPSDA